jgi:hypothetical protein
MFLNRNEVEDTAMARIIATMKQLQVFLSARERRLLGRPNFNVDQSRISSVTLGPNIKLLDMGIKVSRSSIFGRSIGEYRNGPKKVMVLGKASAPKHIVISIQHPTIDEIIYCGNDAEDLYKQLKNK